MKNPVKIGVIGLGNMGKHHVRNYAALPETELLGICDVNPVLVEDFSKQYSCKGFTDVSDLLALPNLEAVSITTPTFLHYDITRQCLERGLHVLIEKPISHTVETAKILVALAKEKNRILTVGHIERFNPAVQKLKELIDQGQLGTITSLIAKRVSMFPSQIKDANVMIDLAVHDIDIFTHLLGRSPDGLHVHSGRALVKDRADHAELFLSFGEASGYIQVNWITPIKIRTLSVTGTQGHAELDYAAKTLAFYKSIYTETRDASGNTVITFSPSHKEEIDVENREALSSELQHFATCIRTGSQPMVTGEQGIEALSIALQLSSQWAQSR